MVDKEVVDILAEIKHRVSSESPTRPSTNGTSSTAPELPAELNHDYASLAVLARAWDRLPPLVTNRTGRAAKFDLWVKAKIKTAFRWFTWEQVNFNAATHQTFKQLIETLGTHEQQLKSYVQQLQVEVDELHRQLDTVRDQNEQFRNALDANLAVLRSLQSEVNSKLETLSTYLNETKTSAARENEARLEEVLRELREKHEQILDEHRVSFKQLSLQLTEAQVLQDRARRELDDRVAKLES